MFGKLDDIEKQVLDLVGNIDSRKACELEEYTARFKKTIEVAQIAICQWNDEMELEMANRYFFDNLQLSTDASMDDIFQRIRETFYAEDLVRIKEEYSLLIKGGGKDYMAVDMRQRIDGKTRWYRVVVTILFTEEKIGYTALCWNITAEKEACQKLLHREATLKEQNNKLSKLVLDLESRRVGLMEDQKAFHTNLAESNAAIWSWRVPEGLFQINLPSLESVEQEEDGVYTFDKIIDKVYPEDIQKIQIDRAYDIYTDEKSFSIELRLNYDGSEYNWFEFRGSVVDRDDQGNATYLRGIFLNIQKRKNNELALQHEIDRLKEADKVRNTIFSNLTQEIRTPLHAIVGFSDILTTIEDKNERQKYMEVIKTNNETLLNIIEGVMEYSELEQEEEALKRDSVCLWEYMVELHQVYSMKMDSSVKLIFTNSYDSRRVIIDKEKVNQVLGVLLNNAIKFTKSGYISYGFEYADDKLIFVVNDTGIGISSDKLENIFCHFEKAEAVGAGGGFGLSICKSLVNKMNGQISVNSKPGAGSSFTIELPLEWDEDAVETFRTVEVAEQKEETVVKNDKQLPVILVAEDVLYSFLMLKTLLEDRFEVIHAENGEHAVELFREVNPVFVFMDIKMPVMDGIEATRQIRAISSTVPIVVLTAYAVRSLRKDAAEAGCTDMLTKPTSSKQINATIRKYLKKDN